MQLHRVVALCTATMLASLASGVSAQDCDRYPGGCRMPPAPRQAPPAPFDFFPRLFEVTPRPYEPGERPYEPAPRPYDTGPRSYEPGSRPYDTGPRSYEPGSRPYEPAPGLERPSVAAYGPVEGEPFPVPAIKLSAIDPAYLRTSVSYPTREAPGTIIVDPGNHFLYLVQEGGRAMRYGVGVGRQGFGWSGVAEIHDKREWPDWYPPKEMLQRQPELMRSMSQLQSGIGMPGGPRNPLGARALYLWQGNKDTLYRIHGTVEPWTIGKSVSSGCIRMINQDVIDLYDRAPAGARVVVLGSQTG